ncbi:MAG: hypothetical protein EB100_04590, partial [Crocinitomicaceae bacterium]|nr:hypothetical protein [Crocinitomicaceae bacterium]
LTGCSSNEEEQNKLKAETELAAQKLEETRLKVEEERLKLEEEKRASEDALKRKQMVDNARLERKFPSYTEAVVVVNRSYFFGGPDIATKSPNKFIISGDICTVVRTRNGFGFIDYYNGASGKTTSGWINLKDLEPLDESYDY